MATLVDLANDALAALGQAGGVTYPFLNSLDDDNVQARICKRFLSDTDKSGLIGAMLEAHKWNFAQRRASIAVDVTAPAFEYLYAYTLPEDYLRVHRINQDQTVIWKVEAGKILTDEISPIQVEYTAYVTDLNNWSAQFYQCVSMALQIKICAPLTGDMKKAAELYKFLYDPDGGMLSEARASDGAENSIDTWEAPDLRLVRG
jgi:hypothetical protein